MKGQIYGFYGVVWATGGLPLPLMRIVVNARFWMPDRLEGYGYFIEQVVTRLVQAHPEHEFYLIFDRPPLSLPKLPAHVRVEIIGPPARHPWLWVWWYDWRLPVLLKKLKADLFVSPDGIASLRTKIPQCLVIHDLAFLHAREWFPASIRRFYINRTPRFLRKIQRVATVSETSKKELIDRYGLSPDSIDVVFNAAKPVFRSHSDAEIAAVKSRYTDGKEYFLYTGAIHPRKNLIGLLKAFSLFKKRQQNGYKLVLAGRMAWHTGDFVRLLSTYKYRSDVVLTGYLPVEELVGLTASAYALAYPSFYEGFGVPVLEAMQSDVPVITSLGTSMQEIAGSAALYADPANPTALAEQLNRLYVDESLRCRLIELGREVSARYSWEKTAQCLWSSMMAAARRD